MTLLTEQEIRELALTASRETGVKNPSTLALVQFARAIEAQVIKKIKAQGLVAFEYNGEPWFDGNNWHEQKELTKDRKVAEFKAYLGKPPVPLYRLPEGD